MKFTPEQIEKVKDAQSAEELLALARSCGVELNEEEAAQLFAKLQNKLPLAGNEQNGVVADEELANVSGGCGEPQEHQTNSTWAAEGCKCNSFWPRRDGAVKKCGNCVHFVKTSANGDFNGVCRREFAKD